MPYIHTEKMNLKNYKRIDRRHICFYPCCLVAFNYSDFFKKRLNRTLNTVLTIFDNGMWNCVIDVKQFDKAKELMFRRYMKDPKIIDSFFRKFRKGSKKYLDFTKTLINKDYSKLSGKDLAALYERYNKGYIDYLSCGEPPVQLLKGFLEKELKARLLEIVKHQKTLNKIFSLLITPPKDTFIAQEEKDLVKLAIKKGDISRHAKKYAWISVDYNSRPLSEEDFKKELKKIRNPKKRLKELENKNKKIKEQQLKIKKKYNIDKDTFRLCLAAQKCMYMMDFKRAEHSKAHYHMQFLMKEIGKRLGLSLVQANFLTPLEIRYHLTKNKKVGKNMPEKRRKSCIYITDNDRLSIAAKKLEKEIRKAIDKESKKIDDLKGICGNPGKVRGKARVITTNRDFHRFKRGEILITAFTTPDFTPILKKAAAVVTDFGGITSHASIISRELKIPCIIGTEHATKAIKTGDLLELDADKGVVKKCRR